MDYPLTQLWVQILHLSKKGPQRVPSAASELEKVPKWSPKTPNWSPEASKIYALGLQNRGFGSKMRSTKSIQELRFLQTFNKQKHCAYHISTGTVAGFARQRYWIKSNNIK